MSKFVKEGSIPESDLKEEAIRALEEELIYLKNEEQKTRKSLQEQLYENRVRKAAEYQELTSKLNSTYKISEKDMEYYEILRKKEEMRELDKQIQEEESLEEFRR